MDQRKTFHVSTIHVLKCPYKYFDPSFISCDFKPCWGIRCMDRERLLSHPFLLFSNHNLFFHAFTYRLGRNTTVNVCVQNVQTCWGLEGIGTDSEFKWTPRSQPSTQVVFRSQHHTVLQCFVLLTTGWQSPICNSCISYLKFY